MAAASSRAPRAPSTSGGSPTIPPLLPGVEEAAPILLVDDQPANLDALEATLATTGCKFVLARSADEALLALLDQDFAAIVLDVMMPGMSGFELATMIRRRERTRQVPILFLTARMLDQQDELRGYRAGPWIISPSRSTRRFSARRSPSSSTCFVNGARCRA